MTGGREQNAWVDRVLGIRVAAERAADASALRHAASVPITVPQGGVTVAPPRYPSVEGRAVWREAREAVDVQFAALQSRLRESDDPGLQLIADRGMAALTARLGTQMMVALAELDAAPPPRAEQARAQARHVIGAYRQFLAGDGLVGKLEANPFGVTVSIRATLGTALDQIEAALGP